MADSIVPTVHIWRHPTAYPDLGGFGPSLAGSKNPTALVRTLAFIFTVPQELFAIFAIICGITLIGWVTYNSLIKRVPQYSGGFLTFGIGPALISFGVLWLRQTRFRRPAGNSHESEQ
jgi:hypothetical protein